MANEMQVFNNEQFGQIRTTTINGEPWFVAADVCKALDINDASRAMARLDEDEGGRIEIAHPQNQQKTITVNAVNESGLYELVLGSRKKEAKAFKRWIKHEVLPSIRKTGGYIMGEESMTDDEIMASALLVANRKLEERAARIKSLEDKITLDAPKVEFAENLAVSSGSITVKEFATLMSQKGYRTGEIRMFEELRQDGFLLSTGGYYNKPAQRYVDMKMFEIKVTSYNTQFGRKINEQTLITPKGIEQLMGYYMRKHGILPLLTTAAVKQNNYRQLKVR